MKERIDKLSCASCGADLVDAEADATVRYRRDVAELVIEHLDECPSRAAFGSPIFGFEPRWTRQRSPATMGWLVEIGWTSSEWGAPLHLDAGRDFLIGPRQGPPMGLAEMIVDAVVPSAAIPLPPYADQVAAVQAILDRELTGTPLAPRS